MWHPRISFFSTCTCVFLCIHTQTHTRTSVEVSLLSSEGLRVPRPSALEWGSRPCPSSCYSWTVSSSPPYVPLGCLRREVGWTLPGLPRSLTLYSSMLSRLLSWAFRKSRNGGKGNTQRALSICFRTEGSNMTQKLPILLMPPNSSLRCTVMTNSVLNKGHSI